MSETTEQKGVTIVELRAENVKKLKAVEIHPKGNTVIISGANGQGKTSVLDSIFFAFAGKNAQKETPKPIRDGETGAEVNIVTSDGYKLRRWWTSVNSYLEITAPDGAPVKAPQELLDSWSGMLTFDPLAFSRMSGKQQRDELLGLVECGIDLDKWDADVEKLKEERKLIGRDSDQLDAQVKAFPIAEMHSAPDEEVSVAKLVEELQAAQNYNDAMTKADASIASAEETVGILKDKLAHAMVALQEAQANRKEFDKPKDTAGLKKQIDEAETTNAKARRKKEYLTVKEKAADALTKYRAKEKEIDQKGHEKIEALKKIVMPIEGLTLDVTGVFYNGQPFSQISSAEQLRVSLAIAMAKKTNLRVVRITDGSLLDEKNMELVAKMAEEHGFQIWIEKVDTSGKVGIVIEDGLVVADNSAPASAETPAK